MAKQTPTENAKFKVIIVGGSIAGLTLAHCLHQANIDHVVLEKRGNISPQEGAFIGVWPNGARVLEQLGLYADMEKLTAPLHKMNICYPDGYSFSSSLPKIIHDRFGYPIVSLDRQKVLKILHDKYPIKSNILVNKRVAEVQLLDDGGRVITDDGTAYDGHLIVGADGVHSRIRSEMWRLADARNPGLISPRDKQSMTVEYACVFGISSPISGLLTGEHVNSYSNGSCVITFHGKDGRVFWFIIKKLPHKLLYPNIPRYSASDAADFCDRLSSVRVWKNIHVADLWENKICASMTALEEGMLETWSFDRIVLFGDSIHKMAPNIGQGANTAVEDAAILASLLNRILKSDFHTNPPKSRDIQKLLQEFQALRYKRVKDVCRRSWFGARLHTRDDFLKAVIGRYIFPYISSNLVTARTSMAIAGGGLVDYLPSPKRSGVGWVKYASNGQFKAYQRQWTLVCVSSIIFCSLLYLCRVALAPALVIMV